MKRILPLLFFVMIAALSVAAQSGKELSEKQIAEIEQLFATGNGQLEKKQYSEALNTYRAALKFVPDDPALLYNAGFAALLSNDNATAVTLWTQLKKLEPVDWQVRAKLVQAYQRLDKIAERDRERDELLALRKKGSNKELTEQLEYCRDRFDVGGKNILAFEVFEFKGPRGVRYIFRVLDEAGREDYRISLGSYDMTNAIWRETSKPTPKDGERLFHLDGYFKNGGHATYGMFPGEPSYEATKKTVIDILEKRKPTLSATIPADGPKP